MSNGYFSSRGGAMARVAALALALAILPACGGSSVARPSATQARAATPAASATPATPATPANPTMRQVFEQGVAYPRWGTQSYGVNDSGWPAGVQSMRDQTNARWVEMIVSLDQSGYSATTVYPGSDTLSPDALYVGVLAARQAGVNVFIEPLLNVHNEPDNWSGHVTFATEAQAQLWFQSYWAAYKPYVKAAKAAGASQVSIGAEYDILQERYPDQWTWLAHQVKAAFGGPVTYDANHSILGQTAPSWMKDRDLSAIGVSMYLSLLRAPQELTVAQIEALWKASVLPQLDALSAQAGKPVILTEIGYRNATDALYDPWTWRTSAPADPALQGAAYTAALAMTASDPHIAGLYFWAWNTGQFMPAGPALQAMRAAWARPVAA